MMHFTIESWGYTATIYANESTGAKVMGTISRPHVTRAHQMATAHGDKWTVAATDGTVVLARNVRPTARMIAAALNAHYAMRAVLDSLTEDDAESYVAATDRILLIDDVLDAADLPRTDRNRDAVENRLVEIATRKEGDAETGPTGPDWEDSGRFYAQRGKLFAFSSTRAEARAALDAMPHAICGNNADGPSYVYHLTEGKPALTCWTEDKAEALSFPYAEAARIAADIEAYQDETRGLESGFYNVRPVRAAK